MKCIEDLLQRTGMTTEDWKKSGCDWAQLQDLAADHTQNRGLLDTSAEYLARMIQGFPGVHSVRWRVKDEASLVAKIARKRAEGVEKYKDVAKSNYAEKITDLVGVRALHLFKDDWRVIHERIVKNWNQVEPPVAYIRNGDEGEATKGFGDLGIETKVHKDGYRSVHYLVATQPTNRRIVAEVQVRTIFEEGWSEIDHRVRYPSHSRDQLVAYFLQIFNRLSGSADEMGSFVQNLAKVLFGMQEEATRVSAERDQTRRKVEALLQELGQEKQAKEKAHALISSLRKEVDLLASPPSRHSLYPDSSDVAAMLGKSSSSLASLIKAMGLYQPTLALLEEQKKLRDEVLKQKAIAGLDDETIRKLKGI